MRTAKVLSISLPPDVTEEIQELAREERRSVSEVFREALRQYMAGRDIAKARKQAKSYMKKKGIKAADISKIVAEGRGRR